MKRILIGAGAILILLVIALVIALIVTMPKHPPKLSGHDAEIEQEGMEFGKTINQRGCMTEGLRRGNRLGLLDIDAQIENEYFVRGCLESSHSVEGFCDGVPTVWKNLITQWDEKQCDKVNVPSTICKGIFKEKMEFCHR